MTYRKKVKKYCLTMRDDSLETLQNAILKIINSDSEITKKLDFKGYELREFKEFVELLSQRR